MSEQPPILIMEAICDDAEGIAIVLAKTWLQTYPNADYGITQADIQARFTNVTETVASIRTGIRDRAKRRLWVAKENTMAVGSCMAYRSETGGHIGAVYVLPAYQGRGIGSRLMQESLVWLGSEKAITLWAAIYNPGPIAFYKRLGFEKTGVTREYPLPNNKMLPLLQMVKYNAETPT